MPRTPNPNKAPARSVGVDAYLAHDVHVQVTGLAVKQRRSVSAICGELINEALAARSLMARSGGAPSAHVLASLEQDVQGLRSQLRRLEALAAMATAATVLAGREDATATPEAKVKLQAVTAWSLLAVPVVLKNFNDSAMALVADQEPKR